MSSPTSFSSTTPEPRVSEGAARTSLFSSLGAFWRRVVAWAKWLDDHWIGHVLAVTMFAVICVGGYFLAWAFRGGAY